MGTKSLKNNLGPSRGETLNYKSGVVAKGFLWMAFCHMLTVITKNRKTTIQNVLIQVLMTSQLL